MAIVFDDEKPSKIVFDDEVESKKETPIEDVPKNAWKDLKDNAQGIIEGTKYVPGLQAMSMMLTGENPYSPQNVMAQGKALASTPGALIDRAKELGAGELLTGHPINAAEKAYEAFKEKPISTAMDLYSAGELGIGASKLGAKAGAEIASKTVEKAIPWAAKKAVRVALGPTEEAISARFANPELIKSASEVKAAQRFGSKMTEMNNEIGELYGNVKDVLNKVESFKQPDLFGPGSMGKSKLKGVITGIKNKIMTRGVAIGPEDKLAISKLDEVLNDIDKIQYTNAKTPMAEVTNSRIDPVSVLDIKKKLHQMIDYGKPKTSPDNAALMMLDDHLNNLLSRAPGYQEAMNPVRQRMAIKDYLVRKMGLTKTAEGFEPGNTTINALKRAGDEEKALMSHQKMAEFDKLTNAGIMDEMANAKLAEQFKGGRPQGSRATVGGTIIGGAIGTMTGSPTLGAAAGAATGLAIDRFGGNIAGKLTDFASSASRSIPKISEKVSQAMPVLKVKDLAQAVKINPARFGKYAPQMMRWAEQGIPALTVNHYLMSQRDPEYNETIIKGDQQ